MKGERMRREGAVKYVSDEKIKARLAAQGYKIEIEKPAKKPTKESVSEGESNGRGRA
ncbi:MAG: hypothetical protein LIO53_02155 [Oscillospiraceae bacterium]|nr:hypothetical protein [Oscillospiraceae bacterium]